MDGLRCNEFVAQHVEKLEKICAGVTDNSVFYKNIADVDINFDEEFEQTV